MTLCNTEQEAGKYGFFLVVIEDEVHGTLYQWRQETANRWPTLLTQRQALDWMAERLQRAAASDA